MHNKSEVRANVVNLITYVENKFKTSIKKNIGTDNGVECIMKFFYTFKGIIHQTICVENPEQNGIVEHKH